MGNRLSISKIDGEYLDTYRHSGNENRILICNDQTVYIARMGKGDKQNNFYAVDLVHNSWDHVNEVTKFIEEIQKILEANTSLLSQKEEHITSLSRLQNENASLNDELDKLKESIKMLPGTVLHAKVQELTEENCNLANDYEDQAEKISELQDDIKVMEKNNSTKDGLRNDEAEAYKKANNLLTAQVNDLRAKNNKQDHQLDINKLKQDNRDLRAKLSGVKSLEQGEQLFLKPAASFVTVREMLQFKKDGLL